jgi:glucosamine-6-phosphate deaminase
LVGTGGTDGSKGQIQHYDAATVAAREPRGEPLRHRNYVDFVAYTPDGNTVVTGSRDSTFRLWDATTGEPRSDYRTVTKGWRCAALSPAGDRLATASSDGTVRLWSSADGSPLPGGTLPHPRESSAAAVAFSPNGTLLVVGHDDGGAQLWDLATFRPLGPPVVQIGKLLGVAFSAGGQSFLTTADDGTTRVWPVPLPLDEPNLERLALDLEVRTGLRMDEVQAAARLTPEEWRQRQARQPDAYFLARLADERARQDQWPQAAALLCQATAGPPFDPTVCHHCALACLKAGDQASYQRLCARLLHELPARRDDRRSPTERKLPPGRCKAFLVPQHRARTNVFALQGWRNGQAVSPPASRLDRKVLASRDPSCYLRVRFRGRPGGVTGRPTFVFGGKRTMRVVIERDYDAMSKRAAEMVADTVRRKPDCVLGLATGSTPIGLYNELARMSHEEGLDFSRVTTFNLDEYYGLGPEHDQSYRYFMEKNLFEKLKARPKKTHVPDGLAQDPEAYCEQYEKMIRDAGGIELQVLGIGRDGHIGFNEPSSSLGSRTRLKTLTEETIADNARFFSSEEEVPKFAITMGVATIFEARRCLLMANGVKKAKVVREAIEGPITSQVTASALQLHRDTIVVLDEDAACELERIKYYKHVERMRAELMAKRPTVAAAVVG